MVFRGRSDKFAQNDGTNVPSQNAYLAVPIARIKQFLEEQYTEEALKNLCVDKIPDDWKISVGTEFDGCYLLLISENGTDSTEKFVQGRSESESSTSQSSEAGSSSTEHSETASWDESNQAVSFKIQFQRDDVVFIATTEAEHELDCKSVLC